MEYRQKVGSYKIIFYDMDGEELDVDAPEFVYSDLDQAIYDWEMQGEIE